MELTLEEYSKIATDTFTQGIADGIEMGDEDFLSMGITFTEYSIRVNDLLNEVYDMGVNAGQWMYQLQQDKEIK